MSSSCYMLPTASIIGCLSKHGVDDNENVILSQLFKVIRLAKCILTIPELNWDQRFRNKTKLNIFHHILTSSTQLQNRSFHGVERTRTVCEMSISEKCTYKACKACKTIILVAVVVVVAYAS